MSVTIKDVARAAGCSIKTVSRVINDEPYVTDELRVQVKAAIRATGYAPNVYARRLIHNRSFTLGVLMYPGFYQQDSSALARVFDVGYDAGYDVQIQPYYPSHKRSRDRLVNLVNEHHIDGFISTPPCDADGFVADLLTTYKKPLVQIDPLVSSGLPSVSGDHFAGAKAMTEYLIALGHRSIAFLQGPRNLNLAAQRFAGYQQALAEAGIVLDAAWVEGSEFTFDGGYTAAKLLLARPNQPTAIFAGNDEAGFGAMFAIQELGRSVPGEISVCGYDDLPLSKQVYPGLTTVHQPAEALIETAVVLLIQLLNGEKDVQQQVVLPAYLTLRGSTARAKPS